MKTGQRSKNSGRSVKNAADHDTLTALYNRRYLNQYLEQLIQNDHTDFYAVLLDLDFSRKSMTPMGMYSVTKCWLLSVGF